MDFLTADLVDAHEADLQSCAVPFRQYGGRARFHGPVRTLRTFEDNAKLKALVGTPGNGAVLVVDGGGSLRTALVGDVIAEMAQRNGWAGLVLWGAVRDTVALARLDLGIKALGSNPWKSSKASATSMCDCVSAARRSTPVTGPTATRTGCWSAPASSRSRPNAVLNKSCKGLLRSSSVLSIGIHSKYKRRMTLRHVASIL